MTNKNYLGFTISPNKTISEATMDLISYQVALKQHDTILIWEVLE